MDDAVVADPQSAGIPPRRGPWLSHFVGAFVAAAVALVWAFQTSPSGGEGLMGVASFATRFFPALPRAMALGVTVVLIANKLVSLAPEAVPWVVPPPETIDGHYKASWLAAFVSPFVIAPVFGMLPLAILVQWLRVSHVQVWPNDGSGVLTAAVASMFLVPRLGRALMREIDVHVHARRPPDDPLEP